ncbi:hypothetical protein LINPERPRIM_LOCUS37428 [Linum perenne]
MPLSPSTATTRGLRGKVLPVTSNPLP